MTDAWQQTLIISIGECRACAPELHCVRGRRSACTCMNLSLRFQRPARSVTPAEIVAAIAQQTGRELDKRDVELPDIKTVGTYDARVRLHPEVFGEFKVVVQREKNA